MLTSVLKITKQFTINLLDYNINLMKIYFKYNYLNIIIWADT